MNKILIIGCYLVFVSISVCAQTPEMKDESIPEFIVPRNLDNRIDSTYGDVKDVFRVKRIKSDKDIYLLYLERADTLYKAYVYKAEGRQPGKKIRVGGKYLFDLYMIFPAKLFGRLVVNDYVGGTTLPGGTIVTIERDKERLLWKLYFVRNLKGLYLQKE